MRKKHSGLMAGLALSLVLGLVASCDDDASDQISAFVPGPAVTVDPGSPISGDSVVPDPANTGQPDKGIPTPVPAPTIPDNPDPAAPPLTADDPVSVPPPGPGLPSGSLACTPVTNGAVLTLTASVPAGVADLSVITITNLNNGTTSTVPFIDEGGNVVIPTLDAGTINVLGQTALGLSFTVPLIESLLTEFPGTEGLINFEDGDTLVFSLSITDGLGNVVAIEAPPCDAIIDDSQAPPPQPGEILAFDQLSLQADSFFLAQTQLTGIVGFGPIIGPRAIDDNFSGPGSGAFPDDGVRSEACGDQVIFIGPANAPRVLLDGTLPLFDEVGLAALAPSTTLGVDEPNSVVLANQRLLLFPGPNGVLRGQFSPANFDEIVKINFFEPESLDFNLVFCDRGDPDDPEDDAVAVSFGETLLIEDVLDSVEVLFTLRGTTGGTEEPNEGELIGAQVVGDGPIEDQLITMQDPRFSGVFNLLDVSSNQIRTDITLVVDQVSGVPTQAAIRDLPLGTGFDNPVSGNVPFVTGSVQRDGQVCPPDQGIVCGRFQFNQPFPSTTFDEEAPLQDVLVFSGTFTGNLDDF